MPSNRSIHIPFVLDYLRAVCCILNDLFLVPPEDGSKAFPHRAKPCNSSFTEDSGIKIETSFIAQPQSRRCVAKIFLTVLLSLSSLLFFSFYISVVRLKQRGFPLAVCHLMKLITTDNISVIYSKASPCDEGAVVIVVNHWNNRECVHISTLSFSFSFSLSSTKKRKQDIRVVQNVILEVDKQHVFNTVTIATAHSREEQSHTLKTLPHTHTPTNTHIVYFGYRGTTTWWFIGFDCEFILMCVCNSLNPCVSCVFMRRFSPIMRVSSWGAFVLVTH